MLKILKSYTIGELRKEISKTGIKGYSKLKKPELIELMMQTPERFSNLKMKAKKERSEAQKKNDKLLGEKAKARLAKKKEPEPEPVKEEEPEGTHTMPDGTVMTGATHNKDSKPVKEAKKAKSKPKTEKPKSKPKSKPKKKAKGDIYA